MCPGDFAIFGVKFAIDALPRVEVLALVGVASDNGAAEPAEPEAKPGGRKSKRAPAKVEEPGPETAETLAEGPPAAADS